LPPVVKKTVDGIKKFIGSMHNELEEMGINEKEREGKGKWEYTIRDAILTCAQKLA